MGKFIMNGVPYGGTNCRELTLQEYQSLSAEEQMNGTMYFVIDGQGENGNNYFYPMLYSTEEREVGTWIDEKPIYARTYFKTNINSSSVILDDSPTGLDKLINIAGSCYSHKEDEWFPVSWQYGNYWARFYIYLNQIYYEIQPSDSNIDIYVTLYYTKTTDIPGSAKYNTLGVPMIHYDDTEKIVGTWFGETLYEKSYVITSIPSSGTTIDNIGNIGISPYIKGSFLRLGRWYNMDGRTESANYNQYYCYTQVMNNGDVVLSYDGYSTSEITKICITIQYTKTT